MFVVGKQYCVHLPALKHSPFRATISSHISLKYFKNSQIYYLLRAPCPWASPQPLRSGPRLVAARECPPPRWPMFPQPPPHVRSWERPVCNPYGNPRSQTSGSRSRQRWRDDWDPRAAWGSPQVNCTLWAWSGETVFLGRIRCSNQEGPVCRGHR